MFKDTWTPEISSNAGTIFLPWAWRFLPAGTLIYLLLSLALFFFLHGRFFFWNMTRLSVPFKETMFKKNKNRWDGISGLVDSFLLAECSPKA